MKMLNGSPRLERLARVVATVAALAFIAGCSGDAPTSASDGAPALQQFVITEGAAAPVQGPRVRTARSDLASASDVGGSATTPVSLKPQGCEPGGQQVVITYTITGRQDNEASFQVNTRWEYDGTSWSGSVPTTVISPPRGFGQSAPPPTVIQVTITAVNASAQDAGASSFAIVPFNVVTSGMGALNVAQGNVTVHVAFFACPVTNTPPTLVLPNKAIAEATSSAGAVVSFASMITASDAEDGDLTSEVECTPASGSTFPLGVTTVNCSVEDSGGLTAEGSFKVKVRDTTPAYFTSFPAGTVNLIAADIDGAVLDISSLSITVEDVGNVSEPSAFSCDYVAGTALVIGSTTTISCTAKDALGNESTASTFDVFVGLKVNATGFLTPLRMNSPFSAHKRGSTTPHKFLPPSYADGTPAVDLAGDLRLVIKQVSSSVAYEAIDVNDQAAGSTVWRYDDGQYTFNLKTLTTWNEGSWETTASYKGITLATTRFDLRR